MVLCDVCGGLVSATARRCSRCAAARVEGDVMWVVIGFDVVDVVDVIEVMEIVLDGGWMCEVYVRVKREELARLETRGERRERVGRGDVFVVLRWLSLSVLMLDDEGVCGMFDVDLDE